MMDMSSSDPTSLRRLISQLERHLGAKREHSHARIRVAATGAGPLLAAILANTGRRVIFIARDDDSVGLRLADCRFFLKFLGQETGKRAEEFPGLESSPYAQVQPDRGTLMRRLALLSQMARGQAPALIVTGPRAASRRVVPATALKALSFELTPTCGIAREDLVLRLQRAGYTRTPVVEDPGTFALRGAVVDTFSPAEKHPVRIEYLGDDIERLRTFDPSSQRTLRSVDLAFLSPVRQTLRTAGADPRARLLAAAERCRVPSSELRALIERVESGQEFFGIESLVPLFHETLATLFDHAPADSIVIQEDPDALTGALERQSEQFARACAHKRDENHLVLQPHEHILSSEDWEAALEACHRLDLKMLSIESEDTHVPEFILDSRPNTELRATFSQLRLQKDTSDGEPVAAIAIAEALDGVHREGNVVRLVVNTRGHAERIASLLRAAHREIPIDPEFAAEGLFDGKQERSARLPLAIVTGALEQGFSLPGDGTVFITETDLFGQRGRREATPRKATREGDLTALREGDAVVHDEHGVGRYRGLKKIDVRGVSQDFLQVEYDGGTVYVPVYRLGLVSRFSVTGEGGAVRLDKLGGRTWQEKKKKASGEARKLAEELLQLYAHRKVVGGRACPPPDSMFRAFEETFPFDETPDQLRAIEEVLADLQSDIPMERLVCGDVGYGKTEVAMRATLLVVESGRQVAILAPTTVLCEQHAASFTERFRNFPVRVAALSRFRGTAEQKATIADAAAGRVDVIVGTHRLLSQDVSFKNLGLVVIDEEQRFGVAHKERLKKMRAEVDVLTLTATPIPRTLQMAMGGLRPMSTISTPPNDRLAIRTFVCRFDRDLLQEAIIREMDRGGQVFFVHNRIQDIDRWASELRVLVPKARIAVAHGQMSEGKLERMMVDFVAGQFDILCATTIIESGLDIPRANTIIVNQAERLGLAQLYQLRGRVGRARERAYCYFVVSDGEALSEDAQQRLAALERFSDLGAGFHLAYADMEIRGAGELLGARQSGTLATIGFEAYARILEEAIAELDGRPIVRERDPEISVDVASYLPDDYIPDPGQRLDLYRRLAQTESDEGVEGILEELTDRYGPPPKEALLLARVMADKLIVRRLRARAYELTPTRFVLALGNETPLDPVRVLRLCSQPGTRFKLSSDMRLTYAFTDVERRDHLTAARHRLLEIERTLG
jgi:transcription-repair coupling factor (superfamily II helicase)